MTTQRLPSIVRHHLQWLIKGWEFWLPIPAVFVILCVSFMLPGTSEDRFRYAGTVLQLLGVGTVAYEINNARKLFRLPRFRKRMNDWWQTRVQKAGVHGVLTGLSGTASSGSLVTATLQVGTGLEARIDALDEKTRLHEQRLNALDTRLAMTAESLKADAVTERTERTNDDQLLREQLKALGVGSININLAGLLWLIVGIICATIPRELARLIALVFC